VKSLATFVSTNHLLTTLVFTICRFIKQEAEEKASEIMVAAEEEVGLWERSFVILRRRFRADFFLLVSMCYY
jgi:hypothetical protein